MSWYFLLEKVGLNRLYMKQQESWMNGGMSIEGYIKVSDFYVTGSGTLYFKPLYPDKLEGGSFNLKVLWNRTLYIFCDVSLSEFVVKGDWHVLDIEPERIRCELL